MRLEHVTDVYTSDITGHEAQSHYCVRHPYSYVYLQRVQMIYIVKIIVADLGWNKSTTANQGWGQILFTVFGGFLRSCGDKTVAWKHVIVVPWA